MDTITIDDLDRQLAQCLGVDGRASFSQLAEVLGVSDQTVARRYRRLRSAGMLRVVGLKARKQLGSLGWFLRIRCVPGAGPAIAAALARRADTAWIQLLSGNTEVLCTLRGDAREDREALLAKLPRGERIVDVTAHSLLHMFTGGPDALGFLQVLPALRVEPLRQPVRATRAAVTPAATPAVTSSSASSTSPCSTRSEWTGVPRTPSWRRLPAGRSPRSGAAWTSCAPSACCIST